MSRVTPSHLKQSESVAPKHRSSDRSFRPRAAQTTPIEVVACSALRRLGRGESLLDRWRWGSHNRERLSSAVGPDVPLHFEEHIKPLFRERDRDSMRFAFDLWSLDDVSTHADAILDRLEAGTMPCDGAWPAERVAVFRRWNDAGKPA